jgi:hypothetical protein
MVGEDKHQALPPGRADVSQDIETATVRQRKIEHHGLGLDGVEQGGRFSDRSRLGDNMQAPRLGYQPAQAMTNRRGILHKQN